MLDTETKRRIDAARDVLVRQSPHPKSQVEQITIALIYKFMDDMDKESIGFGGVASYFTGDFEKYSWTNLFNPKISGADRYTLYEEGLKKLPLHPSKDFPDFFRKIFEGAKVPYADTETLNLFLKSIKDFTYDHSEKLGDAFEYLLSVLGSQGDAGQFRTPRHIIDFIVEVLQPKKNETICDPACGTAGFLISSYKHILKENTSAHPSSKKGLPAEASAKAGGGLTPQEKSRLIQNFVGYDISPDMVRLSLVNMYLHGFNMPRIYEYDTLTSEDRWNEYYDVILANPPFMTPKGGIKPHKKFTIQANRSEVLFVDYIAEHIHPTKGRAGIIVPEGIIFQSATAYKALRKMLVEKDLLYAVVSLPAGIFNPYSGVKTSILLLDKTLAKKTDNILFVKIENDGFDLGAQRRAGGKNDLTGCLELLNQYKQALVGTENFVSNNKNVFLIEKKTIAAKDDYNLSIDRYRVNENVQRSNFEMVRLGDVAEVSAGNSAPQGDEFFKSGVKPFYRTSDVGEVHISSNLERARDNVNEIAIKKFNLKLFPSKTILFPKSGASVFLNHRVMISKEGFVSSHLATIVGKEEKIIQDFLFYVLCDVDAKKLTTDQNYPSLKLSDLSSLEIPLPPLLTQQQIVSKIEQYQSIINGAKQVVMNYKPQIDIDPSWEMVKLGNCLAETQTGITRTKGEQDIGNPFPYLKMDAITFEGDLDLSKSVNVKASSEELKKFTLCNGDFIYNTRNSPDLVGKCTVYHGEDYKYLLNNNILRARFTSKLNSDFANYILNSKSYKEKIRSLVDATTSVAAIYPKNFFAIEIPLPTIRVQQEIVTRIQQEQQLVNANKQLIQIYEQKIKDEIGKLWKTEPKGYEAEETPLSVAAEPGRE